MSPLEKTYKADVFADAKSRAAAMGMPGCSVFGNARPAVVKIADNGMDSIVDEAATRTLYHGGGLSGLIG